MSPIEAESQRELPDPPQEDNHLERPSLNLNRARHSWRSGRSFAHDDREDAKSYRAVSTHDYGAPGRSSSTKREVSNPNRERQRSLTARDLSGSNPRQDHRYSYYDHPYYNHPYMHPYNGPLPPHTHRDAPPRASWRSSATVGVSPSRASKVVPPSKAPADEPEPSDDESDHEEPMVHPMPRQHQRPLTWGYDGNMTPPPPPQEVIMRLPFTEWMNSGLKEHFVATLAEFVGTVMFLFFAFAGTQVANINASNPTAASTTPSNEGFSPIVLTYIALSFGFSLMVNVWIFYRISGGLFNPAVTLGMVMVKSLSYTRGFLLVCAQITGSIITSLIVKVLFPVDFNVRTTLSPGTSLVQGVFIEGLLTAELVFAIFMLAKEKHRATYLAPIGIGIAMFVAELVGVYYTGGSLNPARSFGPCVVTGIWDKEHWIYWLGEWK